MLFFQQAERTRCGQGIRRKNARQRLFFYVDGLPDTKNERVVETLLKFFVLTG